MQSRLFGITALALVACGGHGNVDSGDDQNVTQKITDKSFATHLPNAAALQPYNNILDSTLGDEPCVTPKADKIALIGVNKTGRVEMQQIGSRTTLASQIGADGGLTASATAIGSVDVGANLLKHFDTSKNVASFLVTVTKGVDFVESSPVALTADAKALLLSDPNRFLKQCGRGFITGMHYAATLYALVQVHLDDQSQATSLAGHLGAGGAVKALGDVKGNLGSGLSKLSDTSGLSISVDVEMAGFSSVIKVPALTPSGVVVAPQSGNGAAGAAQPVAPGSAADVQKSIDQFTDQLSQMLESVQKDMQTAIDQDMNQSHSATMTSVFVKGYRELASDADSDKAYSQIDQTLTTALAYVQDLVALRRQMDDIRDNEIEPFLAAAQGGKPVAFNLASKPAAQASGLVDVANKWRADLGPGNGDTAYDKLGAAIDDCLTNATNGDYTKCNADDQKKFHDAAAAKIAAYANEGRVLPLVFKASAEVKASERDKQCAQGFHAGNSTEVAQLSPAIPASAGTGGAPHLGAWHAPDQKHTCPNGQNPFYSVDASGAGKLDCHADGGLFSTAWRLPVMCVPADGAFGKISDKPGQKF